MSVSYYRFLSRPFSVWSFVGCARSTSDDDEDDDSGGDVGGGVWGGGRLEGYLPFCFRVCNKVYLCGFYADPRALYANNDGIYICVYTRLVRAPHSFPYRNARDSDR